MLRLLLALEKALSGFEKILFEDRLRTSRRRLCYKPKFLENFMINIYQHFDEICNSPPHVLDSRPRVATQKYPPSHIELSEHKLKNAANQTIQVCGKCKNKVRFCNHISAIPQPNFGDSYVCLPACLPVWLSGCLSVCLYVCMYVYIYTYVI